MPLTVAGTLAAAGAVGPAAMAAPTSPAGSCGHKVVQPFGLNALTDKHASALAKLTPRRGCGTAALPGGPGAAASPKAASPTTAAPGATAPGTIPGIPDPRAAGRAAAARPGLRPDAITPRADLADSNIINSVAATSATDAWAVGTTFSSSGEAALIEHWDGSTWRVVPDPALPAGATISELFSVTAVSAASVWAVGTYEDSTGKLRALTMHWDGTQWTFVFPSILFANEAFLLSVSANSASDIWAVGFSDNLINGEIGPITEHWDGTQWNLVRDASSASFGELTSVRAISATNVVAVGLALNSSGFAQTLAERWDGAQWTIVSSPNVGTDSELFSVTATSATDAWAVGFSDDSTGVGRPLAEHWNGTAWSVVAMPAVSATFGELRSVTATSATNAWAVGDAENASGVGVTVAEHWNGTAWSVAASPHPGSFDQFTVVVATAANDAWAAGVTDGAFDAEETLAAHWNGTAWKVVASPDPGTSSGLFAVAASSGTNAWAVGDFNANGVGTKALAEHWDGTSWTAVPTPAASSSDTLFAVTTTSATDAWAVGGSNNGAGSQLLAEHWNGTAWTIVTVSSPAGSFLEFSSVKAISATNAWAVGSYEDTAGVSRPLTEHWNGTSWSIVAVPDTGTSWFNSVTATSATNAWAAGVIDASGIGDRPLIEHWNGANWSVAAVPDPGQLSVLTAVTATSTTNALAVGFSGFPTAQQLTERWNGTAWSPVSGSGADVIPEGIAATSVGNAWAVGSIIQRWNGAAWTTAPVTSPLPGTFFQDVAATSATDAWAVGGFFFIDASAGDGAGTAILHWNGTSWSPVPSP